MSPAVIKTNQNSNRTVNPHEALRLGFVPLTDCAPLVMAKELGSFRKFGLTVSLSRELGWATIRDKIVQRELDAAHAVAGMPFAATLGVGSIPCDCLTGLVLNQHGNGITVSADLWRRGVRDAAALRKEILRARKEKTFTFGVVYPFSSHDFLLRGWLASAGIDPNRDVRIVVMPPPQMPANLKAGHLDGFCAGEPWNSVAAASRAGYVAAASAELAPHHPEKVLLVRREFAEKRKDEHLALIAALLEACAFCESHENRDHVADVLSRPGYVGAPAPVIRDGLEGRINAGLESSRTVADFCVFHGDGVNEPSCDKAAWVLQHIRHSALCKDHPFVNGGLIRRVFRTDIFEEAVRLQSSIDRVHKNENQSNPRLVPA